MSTIENLDTLSAVLDAGDLKKLDDAASVHLKQSNIRFAVTGLSGDTLSVRAEQGQTGGNYARYRTLIKRAQEVFGRFLPAGVTLDVMPVEFRESPTAVVSPGWISRQMEEKGVSIRQIAFDTDIDRKDIAGWVTGERNMSRIVRALFYYYFKSL